MQRDNIQVPYVVFAGYRGGVSRGGDAGPVSHFCFIHPGREISANSLLFAFGEDSVASHRARGRWRVPLNFLAVVLFRVLSVVVGFALIYRPFLSQQFVVAPGMDPSQVDNFMTSMNLSLSSLITVSTELRTNPLFLQFLLPIEAVLGFAIFTASISWLLSVYPVIEHRRSLDHEITLVHYTEEIGIKRLEEMKGTELQELLLGVAAQLTTIRTELSQLPILLPGKRRKIAACSGSLLPRSSC